MTKTVADLLIEGVTRTIETLEKPVESAKQATCVWCKESYPAKDMIWRRGREICFFCIDRLNEAAVDAKREVWEARQPQRDEDEDEGW